MEIVRSLFSKVLLIVYTLRGDKQFSIRIQLNLNKHIFFLLPFLTINFFICYSLYWQTFFLYLSFWTYKLFLVLFAIMIASPIIFLVNLNLLIGQFNISFKVQIFFSVNNFIRLRWVCEVIWWMIPFCKYIYAKEDLYSQQHILDSHYEMVLTPYKKCQCKSILRDWNSFQQHILDICTRS